MTQGELIDYLVTEDESAKREELEQKDYRDLVDDWLTWNGMIGYTDQVIDVVLDIDTEELAAHSEHGDIGDAYQCWRANDFDHFKPCCGIEMVYESVWQVLNEKK